MHVSRVVFESTPPWQITFGSTSTRRRPNCFNWLHQLRLLSRNGMPDDVALSRWKMASDFGQSNAIGMEESKAVVNLVRSCSSSFVGILQARVRLFKESMLFRVV